jgi:hypothetical protein
VKPPRERRPVRHIGKISYGIYVYHPFLPLLLLLLLWFRKCVSAPAFSSQIGSPARSIGWHQSRVCERLGAEIIRGFIAERLQMALHATA